MGHTGHGKSTGRGAPRGLLLICATAIFLLAFAPGALAGPPTHPRKAALDIEGLNHACGTAVDSKGDVYASSAGESKVKVFDEAHKLLKEISNANEPCALAVDSKGNLYVSESKTGNVLRYHPTSFPFSGTPSYEAPKTIDASGKAKGIAVDPSDDSLYVAEGDNIAAYRPDGSLFTNNEVQSVSIEGATGGTYKLSFEGQSTGWTGQATLGESESGTGDLSTAEGTGDLSTLAEGKGTLTAGSKEITGVTTSKGSFEVGESITAAGNSCHTLPSGTTIVAVGVSTLTVSAAPTESAGDCSLISGSKTITNVSTKSGAFAVGQTITANSIQPGTTITVVGAGTLTLSRGVTFSGNGESLMAGSAKVTNVSGGPFVAGHGITGAGIPEGTTIEAVGAGTLTLSKPATTGGTGVALTAGSLAVTGMSTTTGKLSNGEAVSGPGIQAGTTVSKVNEGAGTFTLSKAPTASGAKSLTADLPYNAGAATIQEALEKLSTIGAGNVTVFERSVTFVGSLAATDVSQLGIDGSGLIGGSGKVTTSLRGFDGHLGKGEFSDATGVTSYTYRNGGGNNKHRYLSVADAGTDRIEIFEGPSTFGNAGTETLTRLELRDTVDGSETPVGNLGLAATAYLGLDPTNGHVFSFDATHGVVDEFDAQGHYFAQIATPGLSDASPTAIAVKPQWDEIQEVTIDATGGTFKLGFEGEETKAIKYNVESPKVEEALESLGVIGAGNVAVGGGPKVGNPVPYVVTFTGPLGKRNLGLLTVDGAALTGDCACITGTGPSAITTTVRDGFGPGAIYASNGTSAGAKLLAYGPVATPVRPAPASPPPVAFKGICGVATDSHGDIYVAGKTSIKIYPPKPQLDAEGNPEPLTTIIDAGAPCALAVDSEGNLYAANQGSLAHTHDEKVVLYEPQAYPPAKGTGYVEDPTPLETLGQPEDIATSPLNDQVYVTHSGTEGGVTRYASAAEGSAQLGSGFCGGAATSGIDIYGANGNVYFNRLGAGSAISVCSPSGRELETIDGSGSPSGPFASRPTGLFHDGLAVDQSNGHVLIDQANALGRIEEFDASGAFVGQFGGLLRETRESGAIALDSTSGPNKGNLYVGYHNQLTAFGPLSYGELPLATTGVASAVDEGIATLEGTVDPHGFPLSECRFEYVGEAAFQATGFSNLTSGGSVPCAESPAEIGNGVGAVPVHTDTNLLSDAQGRYRFRLVAANEFGESEGEAGRFGPPLIETKSAQPVTYHEATLRANVDPSGLATAYHFDYGPGEGEYDQSTPVKTLAANAEATDIEAVLTGLAPSTTYHFRLVVENDSATIEGKDQKLTTLSLPPTLDCPNATLRLENNSSHLPDCRAYELVTPADSGGAEPYAGFTGSFNDWRVKPRGEGAGESLSYIVEETLGRTEGNGLLDGLVANRESTGWSNSVFGPSFADDAGEDKPIELGISADQLYSFWEFSPERFAGTHAYLRTPTGFELVGQGSEGTDPRPESDDFISEGGSHVIFSSKEHLEAQAAPKGTTSIYDRVAGEASGEVISVKPGGAPFAGGEKAEYQGSTEDGTAVIFTVGSALYLHRGGATINVANPASFAGISEDGSRLFYTGSGDPNSAAALFVFDVEGKKATQIAPNSRFVNISSDGSHAYFTSKEDLTGEEENEAGEEAEAGKHNLYLWDGSGTRFLARLAASDFEGFPHTTTFGGGRIDGWTRCANVDSATCVSRTTPEGRFLAFQSHADLTEYEGEGHSEIYRYDSEDGSLVCVSCDPSGAPATADSDIQGASSPFATNTMTIFPGLIEDGNKVVFQTEAQLLPEDANSVTDVYEWLAQGAGGCEREGGGCLALISSGQSDTPSYVYSMTPDGHDVFFRTQERLIPADEAGTLSIYDARVEGGFPAAVEKEPCHGDACQGEGSPPPELPAIGTQAPGSGNVEESPTPKPCAKGKRRVKGRCVVVHKHHKKSRHHRAKRNRRAGR